MNDTHSIDAVLHALYSSISGPAGEARDWDRFRSLLFPGARLVRTDLDENGTPRALAMEARAYEVDTTGYFQRESFYETEIGRRVERFGNIAHVFSAFEARHAPGDAKAFKRGVNSVQLFHDGRRWWVVSVLWDNEREENLTAKQLLEKLNLRPS